MACNHGQTPVKSLGVTAQHIQLLCLCHIFINIIATEEFIASITGKSNRYTFSGKL